MPIYEYACQSCNNQFEVKQGFNDAPISTCSKCGGAVNKLISAPAIMFKGTGWYVTDYSDKLKPPREAETKEKPANGKQEAKEKKEGAPASPTATAQAESASSAPSGNSGDSGGTSSSSSSPSSSTSTSSPSSSTSSTSSSSSSKTPSSEK